VVSIDKAVEWVKRSETHRERLLEYEDRASDQLYRDARGGARVMALVVHPYIIIGAPHRLKYFGNALVHIAGHDDVVFMTGEQILDWYLRQRAG
jgi:allantoinase